VKIFANSLKQGFAQHWWTSRTGNLLKSCKTALLKTTHPVLNRASTSPEEICHLRTTEAAADQKYAMQAVVISRLLRSENFILHCQSNDLCIFDLKLAHGFLLPVSTILEDLLCAIIYDAIYNFLADNEDEYIALEGDEPLVFSLLEVQSHAHPFQ
jgi:hypothetical protein